jgi:hypothetical protein
MRTAFLPIIQQGIQEEKMEKAGHSNFGWEK